MKFEEYLATIIPKVGAEYAFERARDAKIQALTNILIEKGIATAQEIDSESEKQLRQNMES